MSQWLKVRGVPGYQHLTETEKEIYRDMEKTLAGRKLTDADVAAFWERTFDELTDKLAAPDLSAREQAILIAELRLARRVRAFLATPEREATIARFGLEQEIAQSA